MAIPVSRESPLQYHLVRQDGQARAGVLHTRRGQVPTPFFMPVASQASVKALAPDEVRTCGTRSLLVNAYHLALRPGVDLVAKQGGIHRFMGWDGLVLSDSGGFQVFSLGGLRQVNDEGVLFRSHIDGSEHHLTPELAIRHQEALGTDIAMCLDECVAADASYEQVQQAMERTHRWAARCKEAHRTSEQALFGIVQGGQYTDQRRASAAQIAALGFDGYAAGGISVGEAKATLYRVAEETAGLLPAEKARYLMGVGSPEDLVEGVAFGFDMFDCALPTRVARTGAVYTRKGRVDITAAAFREVAGPLEEGCDCAACRWSSTAYIHHLFRARELLAYRLATLHNLRFFHRLMEEMREAILAERFQEFRSRFHAIYQPADEGVRLGNKQRWLEARRSEE